MSAIESVIRKQWDTLFGWCYRNRWPFTVTMLLAAAVHYPIYAHQLRNMDSLHVGSLYVADLWDFSPGWETAQGRWGLRWMDVPRGGINLPVLSALLMLFFYVLAGLLLVELFALRGRAVRFLVPILVACAPYVAEVETFHYCSAAYGFSFFLAVAAVLWVVRLSGWQGWTAGALCLAISLGMYQASIGVAAALCLMTLVLNLLRGAYDGSKLGCQFRRMLGMGLLGCGIYYLLLKFFLWYDQVSLYSPYAGGPLEMLRGIPQGLIHAYRDFVTYFAVQDSIAQNYYGQRLAYLALALVALVGGCGHFRRIKRKREILLTCLLLALLPAAVNSTDIVNANSHIELRMAGSLVLVVPFVLALLEPLAGQAVARLPWTKVLGVLCALVLLRGYIVQINNDAMVMLAQKNTIVHLADRICVQLENNADYQAGAQVCILGQPQNGTYDDLSPLQEKASDLVQFGLLSFDPTYNSRGWHSLYWEELGLQLNWCSDEETRKICATEDFQNMPVYPQEGSIQTIDGVVVVKVAPIQ